MSGGTELNPIAVRLARRAVAFANDLARRSGAPEYVVEYDELPPAVKHLVGVLASQAFKWRSACKRERN
jgi:hypothetical protein